jgi:hypothetical protein
MDFRLYAKAVSLRWNWKWSIDNAQCSGVKPFDSVGTSPAFAEAPTEALTRNNLAYLL